MIEIYGKDGCYFCHMAKDLCENNNLEYVYKKVGADLSREELLEMFPNASTVPQIKIDGKSVGGFAELEKHFKKLN